MDNRKELIKLLSTLQITASNVKEILDLGVTDILYDGPIDKGVNTLLHSLKATLLYKYFPEDHKHKKKHERLLKEKRKYCYSSEDEGEGEGEGDCKKDESEENEVDPAIQ